MSLEGETEKPAKTFKCHVKSHRETNPHSSSGPHYCRNFSQGRENCPYRGGCIPYQTGPGSVGGRAYQCRKH